jgi:hypothetical protein
LVFLVKGETVGLFDFALGDAIRTARQADVVVAGNGDGGGFGPVTREVDQHQDVGVVPADLLVTGVQRLVDLWW